MIHNKILKKNRHTTAEALHLLISDVSSAGQLFSRAVLGESSGLHANRYLNMKTRASSAFKTCDRGERRGLISGFGLRPLRICKCPLLPLLMSCWQYPKRHGLRNKVAALHHSAVGIASSNNANICPIKSAR